MHVTSARVSTGIRFEDVANVTANTALPACFVYLWLPRMMSKRLFLLLLLVPALMFGGLLARDCCRVLTGLALVGMQVSCVPKKMIAMM